MMCLKYVGIHIKSFCLNFQSIQDSFFAFLFSIYQMVNIMDIYKSLNVSVGTVMKNPEMLKFVPDHFKTIKMCMNAVKRINLSIKIKLLNKVRINKCVIKLFSKMVNS